MWAGAPVTRRLEARLPGHHVGNLEQLDDGRTRWLPREAWEHIGQRPRLGITFLREPGPRLSKHGLLPWFENLLPERGGELRRRLCALHSLQEGSGFGLLEALGRDLPGAVELIGEETELEPLSRPDTFGDEAEPSISLDHFSSLAGMQLKFTMSMLNQRLSLPARQGDEQWIVKLPSSQFPDLPRVEATTMSWARASGFEVPDHRVVALDQLAGVPLAWLENVSEAFAVRRFDRRSDGSKIHQEDLCQVLDLPPSNKYGDTNPGISFEALVRLVVDVGGEAQGREFARRLGFMVASCNDDAHLKNWSLLWGERTSPTLTPCYDLVATGSWEKFGWSDRNVPNLALALGKVRRFDRLDRAALSVFASASNQSWASEELEAGVFAARSAWPHIREEAPPSMRSAIEKHWDRVPLLRNIRLS
jgi:serine/threonine-protein kinase HipA